MATEWRLVTVAEIAARIAMGPFGSDIKTDNFVSHGVPIIRGSNLTAGRFQADEFVYLTEEKADELLNANAFPGDLVFTHRGTLGQVGLIPPAPYPRYVVSQSQLKLTCNKDKADPLFVYYYFKSRPGQHALLMNTSQTGVPAISRPVASLKEITLMLPPLSEQRGIAQILGTFDDKIELNRRMNETLEAIARSLFKSWFIDFDPVRTKLEGRAPTLPKRLVDLFPASFENSELGQIPKGWSVKRVEEVTERVGMGPFGSSIKVETFRNDGVPIISGRHLHGFMMEDNSFNFIGPEHAGRLKSANVERGDVIFTHAGNIGQVAYIPEGSEYDRYVISQRQFFLRCKRNVITPPFIALYFKSPEGQQKLLANTSSSGVPSIARPVTYLKSIQLVIPPRAVMRAFDEIIEPLLQRFRQNRNESRTLRNLRDALLPKLISGELRLVSTGIFTEVVT